MLIRLSPVRVHSSAAYPSGNKGGADSWTLPSLSPRARAITLIYSLNDIMSHGLMFLTIPTSRLIKFHAKSTLSFRGLRAIVAGEAGLATSS